MPYTLSDYPDKIKMLPENAKIIWIKAFNNAFKQYNSNEKISNQTAWTAIKKAGYRKDTKTGIWKRWK